MAPLEEARYSKWLTTFGCFLLLMPYGVSFFWGNMTIYCTSYLIHYTGMLPSEQAPWILSLKTGFNIVTIIISGFLVRHTGKRPLLIVGIALTSACYFLTYYTVEISNTWMVMTFGVLYGLGDGFVFCVANQIVVDWAGSKNGTYINVAGSGMYIGAVLINLFITWYVNPENKVPDRRMGPVKYFSQTDVLDKVPSMFLIVGTFFTSLQIVGFVLIKVKPSLTHNEQVVTPDARYGALNGESVVFPANKRNNEKGTGSNPSPSPPSLKRGSITEPTPSLTTPKPKRNSSRSNSTSSIPPFTSDLTPRQIITTPSFYALSINFLTAKVTYIAVNSYYKEFGQIWIADDFFLTTLGMAIPIGMIFSSILLGILLDKFTIKNFLIIYNVFVSLIGSFYCFSPLLGVWEFYACTVAYGATICPIFSIYNSAAAKLFGKTHFAANQGLVFSPSIIISLTLSPLLETIIVRCGWNYLFLFAAFIDIVGLVVVVATRFGQENGRHV